MTRTTYVICVIYVFGLLGVITHHGVGQGIGDVVLIRYQSANDSMSELSVSKLYRQLKRGSKRTEQCLKENILLKDRVELLESKKAFDRVLNFSKDLSQGFPFRSANKYIQKIMTLNMEHSSITNREDKKNIVALIVAIQRGFIKNTIRQQLDKLAALKTILHKYNNDMLAQRYALITETLRDKYVYVEKILSNVQVPDGKLSWKMWSAWSRCPGIMAGCSSRERRKMCMDDSAIVQPNDKCFGKQPVKVRKCKCVENYNSQGSADSNVTPYACMASISKSVRYFHGDNDGHFCSGVILSDMWILTAAHCACYHGYCCSADLDFLYSKCDLEHWTVTTGLLKPYKGKKKENQIRKIADVIIHKNYVKDSSGLPLRNDIALFKLDAPLDFKKPNVRPCKLPIEICRDSIERNCVRHSELHRWHCEIAGWGRYSASSSVPSVLRALDVVSIDEYGKSLAINQNVAFTETNNGAGRSCQGDSGGPLVCKEKKTDTAIVIGIMSWVDLSDCESTSKGTTGHTSVSHMLTWISDKIIEWGEWSQTCRSPGDTRMRLKTCLFRTSQSAIEDCPRQEIDKCPGLQAKDAEIRVQLIQRDVESMVDFKDKTEFTEFGMLRVKKQRKFKYLCDKQWDDRASRVVCRQLGFNPDDAVTIKSGLATYGEGGIHTKHLMDMNGIIISSRIQCIGNETNLSQCSIELWNHTKRGCLPNNFVTISCTKSGIKTRLSDGNSFSGRPEVFHEGEWANLCTEVTRKDALDRFADLVCENSGLGRHAFTVPYDQFGKGSATKSFGLDCPDDWLYSTLQLCEKQEEEICRHVSVFCFEKEPKIHDFVKCLSLGGTIWGHGIVRFCDEPEEDKKDKWASPTYFYAFIDFSTVCGNDFGIEEAKVVCRQAGFDPADAALNIFGLYDTCIWGGNDIKISDVKCKGNEHNLAECTFNYGETVTCPGNKRASLFCTPIPVQIDSEGRLDMTVNTDTRKICATNWGYEEARVVCKQLGKEYKNAIGYALPGNAENAWITQVECNGDERHLGQCQYKVDFSVSLKNHNIYCVDWKKFDDERHGLLSPRNYLHYGFNNCTGDGYAAVKCQ
ncbi:unnamed protein product [Owenia fusiformis]|uniref:Uncharacterized protein n=1 Tax=Owenia fusiformis TaxID=6347 RepID=A0A8S4NNW0_OWEFU|nr:unnamed protein product [Owenia fusiformis]